MGSFWWQNIHNWFTSRNPLCNVHHVQRLWLPTLKNRAVGSYKHWNLVECGVKFWAVLIPVVNFNLFSNVNKKEYYWRQQSYGTKGGIKSKSCWEFLGALQKPWGRKNGDCPKRVTGISPKKQKLLGLKGAQFFCSETNVRDYRIISLQEM